MQFSSNINCLVLQEISTRPVKSEKTQLQIIGVTETLSWNKFIEELLSCLALSSN